MAQIGVLGQAILSNPHTPLGTNYHENHYFLIKLILPACVYKNKGTPFGHPFGANNSK